MSITSLKPVSYCFYTG